MGPRVHLNNPSQTHQNGAETVTHPGSALQVPQVPLLALAGHRSPQDTLLLHVHHNGVNGALVALGIQSH